jgi:hypothetical protein
MCPTPELTLQAAQDNFSTAKNISNEVASTFYDTSKARGVLNIYYGSS